MDEPRPAHSLKKPVFRRIPRVFFLPTILVLKEENQLIQVMESSANSLRVCIDFESLTDAWLLIRTGGSFLFELKENEGFKENPSTVFMDIVGILRITGVKPGIGAGHAAGHFAYTGIPALSLRKA